MNFSTDFTGDRISLALSFLSFLAEPLFTTIFLVLLQVLPASLLWLRSRQVFFSAQHAVLSSIQITELSWVLYLSLGIYITLSTTGCWGHQTKEPFSETQQCSQAGK